MQIQKLILNEFTQPVSVEDELAKEDLITPPPQDKPSELTTLPPDNFVALGQEEIERIKKEAFDEGRTEAINELTQQQERDQSIQDALQKLGDAINNTMASINIWRQNLLETNASLAYTIAKKLTYNTLAAGNETRIIKFLQDIMPVITSETKVTIKLSARLVEFKEKIEDMIEQSKGNGQVVCQFEEDISTDDCNVILEGGELHFSQQEIVQKIDELFATYFPNLTL